MGSQCCNGINYESAFVHCAHHAYIHPNRTTRPAISSQSERDGPKVFDLVWSGALSHCFAQSKVVTLIRPTAVQPTHPSVQSMECMSGMHLLGAPMAVCSVVGSGYNRTNELQLCERGTPRHGPDKLADSVPGTAEAMSALRCGGWEMELYLVG